MAKYSIQDTSLIAIGDAIRNKSGKYTRIEYIPKEVWIFKTNNVNSFEEVIQHDLAADRNGFTSNVTEVITVPGAVKLILQLAMIKSAYDNGYKLLEYSGDTVYYDVNKQLLEYEITGDTITIQMVGCAEYGAGRNALYAEVRGYDGDGNLIIDENSLVEITVPNTLTPAQMATEIEELPIIPGEAIILTGDCSYKFYNNNLNWLIEQCGEKMITRDMTKTERMFQYSSKLKNIPFDLNFDSASPRTVSNIFEGCEQLTTIPKLINLQPESINNIFKNCKQIVEIPEESVKDIDWSYIDSRTSTYAGNRCYTFDGCSKLRKFPMSFLAHGNPTVTYSYSIYYGLCTSCYGLDEVINLPIPHRKASWTSNAFNSTFQSCYRLKNMIFETNEDGSPIKIDTWSKQALNLSASVGHCGSLYVSTMINSAGFTTDTQVTDDASYQALKDNPDWWTADSNYSRYNHDSAVRTINSLPDVSAKTGNTISFLGTAGALTDGGAINTLTEEEIAVAAAKGWTVSFI